MLRLGLAFSAVVILLDQLSKAWIIGIMRPPGAWETPFYSPTRIELAPFFDLVMAWNRGVSFGILNNQGSWNAIFFSVLSLVICLALVWWMRKASSRVVVLALAAIIGGAVGNVVDRLRFGAVADFLYFHVGAFHWPAFNLADSAITVGACVLVFDSLFARPTSSKN